MLKDLAPPGGAEMSLADLPRGQIARVVGVHAAGGHAPVELTRRLAELGFLPGERVRVVAQGFPGRDPLAIRIGTGTFALRRFEAACVTVSLDVSSGG